MKNKARGEAECYIIISIEAEPSALFFVWHEQGNALTQCYREFPLQIRVPL